MSLASLTIDLTLGLSRFESDSGKASQIITRDSEKMSRAARAVEIALQKQADQAGRTQGEYLALQAAQAGLGESAQKLVSIIERSGTVSATAGGNAAAGFAAASAAADSSVNKQRSLNAELVQSILQVNAAYEARRAAIVAQGASGGISTDQLKAQLSGLAAARSDAIAQLKTVAAQKQAENDLAATAAASAEVRRTAAQKIVDAQNGLTASYRQQLNALRELRDAGNLTPAQFKQAGTELVNKQPALAQRQAEAAAAQKAADAEIAASQRATDEEVRDADRRKVAAQKIVDAQNGLSAAYREQLAALRELRDAGNITPAQFKQAGTELVSKQPALVARQAEIDAAQRAADAQIAAAEKVAAVEKEKIQERITAFEKLRATVQVLGDKEAYTQQQKQLELAKQLADEETRDAERRKASAQKIIDVQNGLTASYREQLAALRELRDKGDLTPAQFKQAGTDLVNKQPVVQAANQEPAGPRSGSNDAFLAQLQKTSDYIGKTRAEILELEAAQRGLSESAAPFIARIAQADSNMAKFGRQTGLSVIQLQTLKYTLSDVVASLGSGISPFTILLQQGGQVAQIEGGVTGIIKGIAESITPFRAAIGLSATAVAALGYAFYAGQKQSKDFADAIVLTGNYAGQTEGRFNSLTRTISASGQVQVAAAREYGQALIATGQIGPQVFDKATEAAARYGAATGKTAKDVATAFAAIAEDPVKGATELNKQLNFLTAAQYDQIKAFKEAGNAAAAQGVIYDALNDRLTKLEPNLGTLDRAIRAVSTTWHGFWDAAFDVGRTQTIETKISEARAALDSVAGVGAERVSQTQLDPQRRAQLSADAASGSSLADQRQENLRLLLRSQAAAETTTALNAEAAATNKAAIAGKPLVEALLVQGKATSEYQIKLKELQKAFADNEKAGTAFTAQQKAEALAQLKKNFTNKDDVSETDQQRKKQLDQDLKFLADNLAREKDALQFNQQELQAIYASGTVSLADFYERKRATIAAGIQKELNEITDEQARLEVELAKPGLKGSERIDAQTKLNDATERGANIRRDASHAAALASYEEQAALKALGDQVSEYKASLFQLEGEELKAAQIRQQANLVRSQELATRSGGAISQDDVARQARLVDINDQLAEVQRRVGTATADASRAEEAYILRATRGGADIYELENGVYQVRATALVQLGELADKARVLAEASTDPKIKSFAEDLALQYAKAADAVDPAITRLRTGADDLATSYRGLFDNIVSGSVTGSDALKQLGKIAQQIFTKQFISDPFEQALKGGFQSVLGGDGIGKFLRTGAPSSQPGEGINVAGSGYSAAKDSQAASDAFDALQSSLGSVVSTTVTQTAATQTATSALSGMALAAQGAAQALASVAAANGTSLFTANGGSSGGGGFGTGSNYGNQDYGAFLADGTNYVPYDGFKATLHKGERVTPAKYNPSAGGQSVGSGASITINNHASDTTEASAKQNNDGSIEILMRKIVRDETARDIRSGSGPLSSGLKGRGVRLDGGNPRRN